jgi:hypothetical protein
VFDQHFARRRRRHCIGGALIRFRQVAQVLTPAFVAPFMRRCLGKLARALAIDSSTAVGVAIRHDKR